jgi:ABC-type Fe3+-hydroxamate transport system, periplasmic component
MTSLTEEQQERLDIIKHKLKFIEQKPTLAIVKAFNPITLAADDMAGLIGIAGGSLIEGDEQTLTALNPDIIIAMPDDMPMAQTMTHIDELLQMPGFTDLKAVKSNRFYIVDGDIFLDKSNENMINNIELLAEIIYPKQFIFGHEGNGWIKFSI